MPATRTGPPRHRLAPAGGGGAARWTVTGLLLVAWLVLGVFGAPFLSKLSDVQRNDAASFLPASAEATEVSDLQKRFAERNVLPTVAVFERPSGLTPQDSAAVAARVAALGGVAGLAGSVPAPIPSQDGQAAQVVVPVDGQDGARAGKVAQHVREVVGHDLPDGLSVHVTGPGGYAADLGEVFAGIDGKLLIVTALVVAVILVIVYRSPLLPLAVLVGAGVALALASLVVYPLAKHQIVNLNGQTQGIMLILVFGAGTDYALLMVARYREELSRVGSRWIAMGRAWRASLEPIAASAGTVIAGMLCMLFSDLGSNKGLGPIAAIGIAAALLSALTFLPAALVLCGRSAFWPFRPELRPEDEAAGPRTLWARVSHLVGRRPRATWLVTALVLLTAAVFVPQLKADGVANHDVFLQRADAVTGQEVLSRHFPGGIGTPAVIVAKTDAAPQVLDAAKKTDGIADVVITPENPADPGTPKTVDGLVEMTATLRASADSEEAIDTVRHLRDAVHAVPGADAKVGGETANQLDVRDTALRDRTVIIPIVLVVIFVLLALLLRAILAPLLLIATVVLSFGATLGVAALVFNHVFHFPGSDPSVPLYAFVFLVALGIDYNIFLMTRVREEAMTKGTREGTLHGLSVTGGVITSAGVVLAATFAALSVLPILFMAQIAFLVAFGVLLDTLVVRSLLVPALSVDVGRRIWWPSRLGRNR
ncbi:membrane protein [Longimycelium tulufanense]|uniref:Membrane protein n=1 Tax=Longimycelium tulufanense TaxID=907463 RepID=A0A8J3FUN9_9PSEU|nr:MMPL family transporter [Longimycelium tulufanense]GGM56710.1 membrane protein [Longimycelium tulufanense]